MEPPTIAASIAATFLLHRSITDDKSHCAAQIAQAKGVNALHPQAPA
jgi:hypothetical protein